MATSYPQNSNEVAGTYPAPASFAIKVINVGGLPTGAASGDAVTRQADMSLWDTTAAVFVRPEQTNLVVPNQ